MVISESGNVWDVAVAEQRRKKAGGEDVSLADKQQKQATVLVIGTRGAGKTTLVQRFLDREEQPRQTLALEYTYGRRTNRTVILKDVCHMWELGGGSLFSSLLSTPITVRTLPYLTVILMLDLSKPEGLWTDMETLLSELKGKINAIVTSSTGKQLHLREKLTEAAWHRVGMDHPDKDMITPSLVPLVIVGGKYDLFQDMEPENKKVVCRSLRFIAHTNGATVQFFSSRDAGLIKKSKELLSHYGFGTAESTSLAQDYNKPLFIPVGSDSFHFISGAVEEGAPTMTLDAWRHVFSSKFPQEGIARTIMPEDPSKNSQYSEPDIDNLRAHKDQELERVKRELGRNSRFGDIDL